jgi:hypothetical protein
MIENLSAGKLSEDLSVLISGGSGLIGRYLTSMLLSEGYKVSHLSRNAGWSGKVRVYRWDPEKGYIDHASLEGIDYIIHLAGANIGEKRWSKKRKEEIVRSRIDSAKLLFTEVNKTGKTLKAFISASAIGYYGSRTSEIIYTETDSGADDFLGNTCRLWEEAADQFGSISKRVVKIRTGVVMERNDSALSKLLKPARFGLFPRLGNGRQYMPWIHMKDLCGIYLKAVTDETIAGSYNAVAPQHINQSGFMQCLAEALNKFFFHPPLPAILLRTILGEMSGIVLKGSRVSSEKIEKSGYVFVFRNLKEALAHAVKD